MFHHVLCTCNYLGARVPRVSYVNIQTPPLSTKRRISPSCWQRKFKYIPYFAVISVEI